MTPLPVTMVQRTSDLPPTSDYGAALQLDSKFQRAYNNRGAAWRKKGDRNRALQAR